MPSAKALTLTGRGSGTVPETVTVATMSICSPPARTNSAAGENATDQPGGSGCASRRWAARRAMPAAGSRAGLPVASGAGSGHVGGNGGGYAIGVVRQPVLRRGRRHRPVARRQVAGAEVGVGPSYREAERDEIVLAIDHRGGALIDRGRQMHRTRAGVLACARAFRRGAP